MIGINWNTFVMNIEKSNLQSNSLRQHAFLQGKILWWSWSFKEIGSLNKLGRDVSLQLFGLSLLLYTVYFSTLLTRSGFVKLIKNHSSTKYMEYDSFCLFGLFCLWDFYSPCHYTVSQILWWESRVIYLFIF